MPVVATREILRRAFDERYGVAAINVINDLTMHAVLEAAEELRAPVIVQTSVKHVQLTGAEVTIAIWRALTKDITVPVALHLDHCPDRAVISQCLALGWSSVLFDASKLSVDENRRQCIEVVAEARRHGADVEGEIEGFKRTEEMTGDEAANVQSLETVVEFVTATGVDVFAPAIGNAHGTYATTPTLDSQRVTDIVEATGIPVALHGGTGMTQAQFSDLIARGCAKVNISTALKIAFMQAGYDHMVEKPGTFDPPAQMQAQHAAVKAMAIGPHPDVRQRGKGVVTPMPALIFDCDGVLVRHGALRPPAGVQPDVRGVRPAVPLVRGAPTARSSPSAAARSGCRASSRRTRSARRGCRRIRRRSPPRSRSGTRARPRCTRRWSRMAGCRRGRASAA